MSTETQTVHAVVFTRQAIDRMTELPYLELNDLSLHRSFWDMNLDTLTFYLSEESWVWLLLKYPELAQLRHVANQKP